MVKSIFDLEKRTDLKKECLKIEKYLDKPMFSVYENSYQGYSFWTMVNSFIEYWPYRYTATCIQDFFDLYELPWDVKDMKDEQCLYYLQLILDIIMWLDKQHYNYEALERNLYDLKEQNNTCFRTIIKNIILIIELLNYKAIEVNKHYTFIKRDADVDSVLHILESEDDLRLSLLEYNDFRIEKNIKEKRIILKQIGDYLEPKRKYFNTYNKTLTECIFNLLNKLRVRHFDDDQKDFSNEEYIIWYDKLFKMMIHLIRTTSIVDIQKEVKELCS